MTIAGNPDSVEKLHALLVMFSKARDVIPTHARLIYFSAHFSWFLANVRTKTLAPCKDILPVLHAPGIPFPFKLPHSPIVTACSDLSPRSVLVPSILLTTSIPSAPFSILCLFADRSMGLTCFDSPSPDPKRYLRIASKRCGSTNCLAHIVLPKTSFYVKAVGPSVISWALR
jgi:hypothetical protein